MPMTNGVCDECGSGVIGGDLNYHIRDDLPCIDNPRTAEFWWQTHTRLMREGVLDEPLRRNPNDIWDALHLTPEARQPIRDALAAAVRYNNISQAQAANEAAIRFAIARLLDAGVLQRGPNS